jgi:hypothetical protein
MVSCSSNIDHTNLSLVFSTQPKKLLKYIRAFLRVYDNSGQPAFCTSHPNSNVPDMSGIKDVSLNGIVCC